MDFDFPLHYIIDINKLNASMTEGQMSEVFLVREQCAQDLDDEQVH